ncbi:hypothetical protein [Roseovarius aestuarii]|uniref:Uncharacterized protein n=1 Tax=Roseovarius aestuarii TaxID=475083 RepID=A0A1X7BW34_9RHOB|nr:hypothetical protein [Roseovarius aestuarii]SMC13725.1 hypothetical protein ROA7745_03584 [Roseovarius aestuarii]
MFDRRKPTREVLPGYEDQDIFKGQIVQIAVELVPLIGRNSHDDIIIKGFVLGDNAIDVVIAGRRKKQAQTLLSQIQSLWSRACTAARNLGESPVVEDVRYPVYVEGSWRTRFNRDDHGWETRNHQLYAARWTITDQNGGSVIYGEFVVRDV